jgi:hypothetical protein
MTEYRIVVKTRLPEELEDFPELNFETFVLSVTGADTGAELPAYTNLAESIVALQAPMEREGRTYLPVHAWVEAKSEPKWERVR